MEDFTQIDRQRLEKTFMVNIVGMISLAQKAVPHMQPGSAIINVRANAFPKSRSRAQSPDMWAAIAQVASIMAYDPIPGILDYACTKVPGICASIACLYTIVSCRVQSPAALLACAHYPASCCRAPS